MSSCKVKCMKCHCGISEDSVDRLCDNCNMNLIALNLAAEMSQHEIHHEDIKSVDHVKYDNVKLSVIDEPIVSNANINLKSVDSEEPPLEQDVMMPVVAQHDDSMGTEKIEVMEPQSNKDGKLSPSSIEISQDGVVPTTITSVEKDNASKEDRSTLIIIYDESSPENVECEPVAAVVTPTKFIERRPSNDRKRKLDEPESTEKITKFKDEKENNSSSDESDSKNIKVEPMRTRAKVVQEEAAAQKQLEVIDDEKTGENDEVEEDDDSKGPVTRLTRKALAEIEKYKHPSYEPVQTKSRRTKTFKSKPVYKAPTSQASIYSSDYVFYKGRYYQAGDVVVLRDIKRPGDFYAQITSFLTDQYCHKCATIQWLFPTKQSPETGFDPRTYFLGYLDEIPRPLSSLQPVMHLPSDYYRFNKTPYPPPAPDPLEKHYLWKRMEPVNLEDLLHGRDST